MGRERQDSDTVLEDPPEEMQVQEEPEATAGDVSTGVKPLLLEGTRVQVTSGPYDGRMGVIIDQNFASDEDEARFHNPHGKRRMTAKVESYIIRTRDSRNERLTVAAGDLQALTTIDGWGRGQAPEHAPNGEGLTEEEKAAAEEEAGE